MCCMFYMFKQFCSRVQLLKVQLLKTSFTQTTSFQNLLVCSLFLFLVNVLCHITSSFLFLWFMHLVVYWTATSVQLLMMDCLTYFGNLSPHWTCPARYVYLCTLCVNIRRHRGVGNMGGGGLGGGSGRHTMDMILIFISVYKYRYTCLCYICSNYNMYLMIITARIAQLAQWLTVGSTVWDLNPAGRERFSGNIQTGPEIYSAFLCDGSVHLCMATQTLLGPDLP